MKLFKLRLDSVSFLGSVVKIIICLPLIFLCIFRNRIYQFSNVILDAIVSLLCVVIGIASLLCLLISICEVIQTFENRMTLNYKASESEIKQLTITTITEIVSRDDIVEIDVWKENKIIKIGATAENKYTSSVFENKRFYISESEYETVELFEESLLELFPDESVPVLKIDGLPFR